MKQQTWKAGVVMALVIAVAGATAFAAAAAPAPAKEPAPAASTAAPAKPAAPAAPPHKELFWPELWQTLHDPTPWLHMGLDHRFRIEAGENWNTLNSANENTDDWQYQRYRTRWWTKWTVNEDVSFNTRLTWEFRTWQEPENRLQRSDIPAGPGNPTVREGNPDEALLDWFNVSLRNLAGMPLTATLGRQDIIFGVGWLVLDGTPLDGSRTIYFDAARFTYDWADKNTKVDLIYVDQSAESDRWLNPINDQHRAVTEQDEHGAILYLTNTSFKPTQLEGFFIYRNDNPIDNALSNWPVALSQKAEIYTVGAAVSGTPAEHWKYRAEGAFQLGDKTSRAGVEQDLQGYGALANLEYLFKDLHDHATHITYEYASGDDPDTGDNEQFDLLWGEWPRWSELLIYTATFENQPAALSNLHRFNIGHRFNLNAKLSVTGDYHAIWADQGGQPWRTGAAGLNTDDEGGFRGHLLTSWLKYKFSDQLYGHFLAEYFINGDDYFVAPSDDNAYFLRFNFEYIF